MTQTGQQTPSGRTQGSWSGTGDILVAGGYTFYVAENNSIVPLTNTHLLEIAKGDKQFVSVMRDILNKLPVTS